MKKTFTITLSAALLACSTPNDNLNMQTPTAQSAAPVTVNDFAPIVGDGWQGQLSYIDYTSGENTNIPAGLDIKPLKSRKVSYVILYPYEPQYNSKESIKISKAGDKIDGRLVIKREVVDGGLMITTEHNGGDNGEPATVRIIYTISNEKFSMAKSVKGDNEIEFTERNKYMFER